MITPLPMNHVRAAMLEALCDPQGWSIVDLPMPLLQARLGGLLNGPHPVVLGHTNGSLLLMQDRKASGNFDPDCLGISPDAPLDAWSSIERLGRPVFSTTLRLDSTQTMLDGWKLFLRQIHPGTGLFERLQSALQAVILRAHPMATGSWRITSANRAGGMVFSATDATQPSTVHLTSPAWFVSMRVLNWKRTPLTPDGEICRMILQHISLDLSQHRRMEIHQIIQGMPAFDDPAFPVFWGLRPTQ